MKSLFFALLMPLLLLPLLGCQGPRTSDDPPASKKTVIPEDFVTAQGCMSVPAFFEALQKIDPSLPTFQVTRSFKLDSRHSIRKNFSRLLAYGNFYLETKPLSEYSPLIPVQQKECDTLTFTKASGEEVVYTIKAATRTSISAQNKEGEVLRYEWRNPQQIEIETRNITYDLPCRDESPIYVTVQKVFDWQSSQPEILKHGSEFEIDLHFLELLAESVGRSVSPLLNLEGDQVVSEIKTLMAETPRAEVLSCANDLTPEPTPTPPPDSGEEDSSEDGHYEEPAPTPTPAPTPEFI